MSKDTLEATEEQKTFCIWLVDTWDAKGLGAFPYTFGFIIKSLNDLARPGMPISIIRESMEIAMDVERVPAHQKWTYGCGIAWNKFKSERPLRDLVDEWKATANTDDQEAMDA